MTARFSAFSGAAISSLVLRRSVLPASMTKAVVCMPARDEEERIVASLAACIAEMQAGDGIVLVVNGSGDRTAERAEALLGASAASYVVADLQWREGEGSAPAARKLALDLGAELAPGGLLLSLDADTIARPGWRAAYEAEFTAGFDMVCGAIGFDPQEAADLPPADEAQEAVVREYRAASREIAAWIDPDPDNPWPHHGNVGGANFGVTAASYRLAGGLPTPGFGEDRALRRRFEALDLRIRYSEAALAWTSCRLDGRARGGLSDELARSRSQIDPVVDEALEPAAALSLRWHTRRAFREARTAAERRAALAPLGLDEKQLAAVLAVPGFGMAWQSAEEASPALVRRRMRRSELAAALPALLRLRRAVRAEGGPA